MIPLTSDHIVPTAGSGSALDALLFTLCDAGDSIICPASAWCMSFPRCQKELLVSDKKDGKKGATVHALCSAPKSTSFPHHLNRHRG
jgi:hypothetical protein